MKEKRYKIIDHTADLGIEVYGENLNLLFSNAAYAFSEILTDVSLVDNLIAKDIVVNGGGLDQLMVNWLHELLYYYEVHFLLFNNFKIKKIDTLEQNRHNQPPVYSLTGIAYGEEFKQSKHYIYTEIKAVTYHQIEIKNENEIWSSKIIFDL